MPPRRTPNRSTPTVTGGALVAGAEVSAEPIPLDHPAWLDWLAAPDHTTFHFADDAGSFTARRETRRGQSYWYGYRKQEGALHKTYPGKPADLTLKRLRQAAAILGGAGTASAEEPEAPPAEAVP